MQRDGCFPPRRNPEMVVYARWVQYRKYTTFTFALSTRNIAIIIISSYFSTSPQSSPFLIFMQLCAQMSI